MPKLPDIDFLFETSGGGGATPVSGATTLSPGVYMADSSGGAFTLTLPAAPTAGNVIEIVDATGDFATNNVTVNGNGKNIEGAGSKALATDFGVYTMIYTGAQWVSRDL